MSSDRDSTRQNVAFVFYGDMREVLIECVHELSCFGGPVRVPPPFQLSPTFEAYMREVHTSMFSVRELAISYSLAT